MVAYLINFVPNKRLNTRKKMAKYPKLFASYCKAERKGFAELRLILKYTSFNATSKINCKKIKKKQKQSCAISSPEEI